MSLLISTILSARSPTSILAVVRELKAKGPVTDMLVAITVGGDIIVLTLFAINLGVARNMCAGLSFDAASFFLELVLILVAFAMGYVIGWITIGCLHIQHGAHLILPFGFLTYLTCDYILAVTQENEERGNGHIVGIDSLLVSIGAGFVVINTVNHEKGEQLLDYLKKYSKYVFIPFFTIVGLSINLPVLIKSLGFSILACIIRAICMQLGTISGGHFAKLTREVSCLLWVGLLPQAGVSLGLAGVIEAEFSDTFGGDFQSTMIGIILINQIIGPIGAKYLLKKVEEDGKGDDQHPTTGGMHFIADMENLGPRKDTQTPEYLDQDLEGTVLIAKPREINPISDGEDFATNFLDLVYDNQMRISYFLDSSSSSPVVHNPLFANTPMKHEEIETGIEMPDGAIQLEDDDEDGDDHDTERF